MVMIENLEKLLASGQDSALLRYSLGTSYLKVGKLAQAIEHLSEAVKLDESYSAAWKAYGKALAEAGRSADAIAVFEQGIAVAEKRGDIQAAREMKVFLRRAQKTDGD